MKIQGENDRKHRSRTLKSCSELRAVLETFLLELYLSLFSKTFLEKVLSFAKSLGP